ncbi:MAG: stage II sporulation protein M, partial [Candidatus Methanomethylicaceae archaeon]
LAAAGGMNFGFCIFMKIFRKNYSIIKSFKESFIFFVYGLVLLLIAAIIETYLTPFILGI